MNRLQSRADVALLREHALLLLIAFVVALSVLVSSLSPALDREVQIDSARDVNELVCIPWLSKTFPVSRSVWVGLSNGPEAGGAAEVKYGDAARQLGGGRIFTASSSRDPLGVVVEGTAARHLSTEVWAVTDSGIAKGAATDECRPAGQSWWFAGIDTTAGSSASLVLSNPDNEDVIAILNGYTADGVVQSGVNRRVLVRAESRTVVDLNLAFPAEAALAVHVGLNEGRVAASVQAWSVKATVARGRSFIAPMPQPELAGAIVGLSESVATSQLHLLAPDEDATVTVSISTSDGTSQLADVDRLVLSAGQVTVIPLAALLSDVATSLVIKSSHPVIAAVRQLDKSGSTEDLEVQMMQSAISKRASAVVGTAKGDSAVFAYSEAGALITYEVLESGKRVAGGSVEVRPTTTTRIQFPEKLPRGSVLVLESEDQAWLTMWSRRTDGNSSALAVSEESATVVAGTSLLLNTS